MGIRIDICHLMEETVSGWGSGWQTGQKVVTLWDLQLFVLINMNRIEVEQFK